jgi:hypothetical protein
MAYDPHRPFFPRPFPFDPEIDAAREKVINNRRQTQEAVNSILYDFPNPLFEANQDLPNQEEDDSSDESSSSDEEPSEETNQGSGQPSFSLGLGFDFVNLAAGGLTIASNGPNKVSVSEFQDHLTTPHYPHTSDDGILHFVHLKKDPLHGVVQNQKAVSRVFTTIMSEVFYTHANHMNKLILK